MLNKFIKLHTQKLNVINDKIELAYSINNKIKYIFPKSKFKKKINYYNFSNLIGFINQF